MKKAAVRVDSVILVGPRQWALDHMGVLDRFRSTWMQYSAAVDDQTTEILQSLNDSGPLDVYIYVPKRYTCGKECPPISGSGKIEFRGTAITCMFSSVGTRLRKRRPTTSWPEPYDWYKDKHAYEYWFQLERLERLEPDLAVEDFKIYRKTDGVLQASTVAGFAQQRRRQVVLARRIS